MYDIISCWNEVEKQLPEATPLFQNLLTLINSFPENVFRLLTILRSSGLGNVSFFLLFLSCSKLTKNILDETLTNTYLKDEYHRIPYSYWKQKYNLASAIIILYIYHKNFEPQFKYSCNLVWCHPSCKYFSHHIRCLQNNDIV